MAAANARGAAGLDWYSFAVAFKGVLLEGLEVAFIVITFGGTQGRLWLAAGAAGAALLVVTAPARSFSAPLSACPRTRSSSRSGCC